MSRFPRLAAVLLVVTAAVAGVPAAASAALPGSADMDVRADVDDFAFDRMTVDYTLTRAEDGTSRLAVVEEIVARFPDADQNHGIRRSIPEWYNDQPLLPSVTSVTDETGAARPWETDSEDGWLEVISRDEAFLRGVQTFVITYELQNVTWDFPDTGWEFYWDVNGVGWAQPFGEVEARLHLDRDLARALSGDAACYVGGQGASTTCAGMDSDEFGEGGTTIIARSGPLEAYETLTMSVGFAAGTFAAFDAGYLASPFGWIQGVAGVGVIGAVVLAVVRRRGRLADEPGRPTIIAEYAPPPGVDALESAVLLSKTSRAIPAEVLEQAVVGSIRILEGEKRWFGGPKLIAELVDPSRADGDGLMLLDGLFPAGVPGAQYEFGRQDTRVSSAAQRILAAAEKKLKWRGLRRSVPFGSRAWPIVSVVLTAAAAVVFGVVAMTRGVHPLVPSLVIAGSVLALFVVIGLVARMPLSAAGAEVRDHLKGLEQFIAWAEEDRIRMLQSPAGAERVPVDVNDPRQKLDLYEKLLPYAVVFGQEKEWSAQLAVLYSAVGVAGPYWYAGSGSFDASSFATGIGSLSAAAGSSSSTSGGSSGGGSAGGGGGGGGGGGV